MHHCRARKWPCGSKESRSSHETRVCIVLPCCAGAGCGCCGADDHWVWTNSLLTLVYVHQCMDAGEFAGFRCTRQLAVPYTLPLMNSAFKNQLKILKCLLYHNDHWAKTVVFCTPPKLKGTVMLRRPKTRSWPSCPEDSPAESALAVVIDDGDMLACILTASSATCGAAPSRPSCGPLKSQSHKAFKGQKRSNQNWLKPWQKDSLERPEAAFELDRQRENIDETAEPYVCKHLNTFLVRWSNQFCSLWLY